MRTSLHPDLSTIVVQSVEEDGFPPKPVMVGKLGNKMLSPSLKSSQFPVYKSLITADPSFPNVTPII